MSIFKTTEGQEHTGVFVLYARVSMGDQTCTRQIHIAKEWLNGGTWKLKTFTEQPISGASDPYKRIELMKAVDYCRKHKVPLMFSDLDRLCRKLWMTLKFLDEIVNRYKIQVIVCNDPSITESPERLQMKALFAEWERQEISRRTRKSLGVYQKQIKEQGFFVSKDKLVNKQLVKGRKIRKLGVHSKMDKAREKAGDVAKGNADLFAKSIYYYINDAYTSCTSLHDMSIYLNKRNVQTPRGGKWYPSSVKNMLIRLKIGEYK